MEGAANVFNDVLTQAGVGRNWFRVVGGKTTTYNESGSFSILRFEHNGDQFFYREHAGQTTAVEAQSIVPESLKSGANWPDNDASAKQFKIPEPAVRAIYERGAHVFFPSSRSEIPFWLNQDSLFEDKFDTSDKFRQNLGKPLYVERGTDLFAQWLLGVLTESRARLIPAPNPNNPAQASLNIADGAVFAEASNTLNFANQMLQIIMNDPQAQFFWIGRRQARKVAISSGMNILAAGLDSLSGGQSTLLAIFGTILRYGDVAGIVPQDLEGIVVIDELDSHMHIDLQMTALPNLIALFPRVQFIISSHSPFFALGMEKKFPDNGVRILDLPTGLTLSAETYSEFDSALGVLMDTKAFEMKLGEFLAASEQPVIWVSGPTDLIYFQTAAKLLGYSQLVGLFDWVGAYSESGKSEQTGDSGLNSAFLFIKANPNFTHRPVVLVYDNDANKPSSVSGSVAVLSLVKVQDAHCSKGVENLLPQHVFTDEMYQKIDKPGSYGKPTVVYDLRKMDLCQSLCGDNALAANFEKFKPTLDSITAALANLGWRNSTDDDDAGSTDDGTAGPSPELAQPM